MISKDFVPYLDTLSEGKKKFNLPDSLYVSIGWRVRELIAASLNNRGIHPPLRHPANTWIPKQ